MPVVNIEILKGHPQDRNDEIAQRATAAIDELAELPPEAIRVVFEDVSGDHCFVGSEPVSELKRQAAKP